MKDTLDCLVVGGGGREHAIVKQLLKSQEVRNVHVAPGLGVVPDKPEVSVLNPRIVNTGLGVNDFENLARYARDNNIYSTTVGPEGPLVNGIVDFFQERNLRIHGPSKAAARVTEGSKVRTNRLFEKNGVPTAEFGVFSDAKKAKDYARANDWARVVKADGLCGGKGVIVCNDLQETYDAIDLMLLKKKFGSAGDLIVLEEKLVGIETSLLAYTDGIHVKPMIFSQDHKAAFACNKDRAKWLLAGGDPKYENHLIGPNTGGMGAYAPVDFIDKKTEQFIFNNIMLPTVHGLHQEGTIYQGVIYIGLMLTKVGPKALEINCRFGDPETQVVLPLQKTDLRRVLDACSDVTLENLNLEFYNKYACCVVMASGGYPDSSRIKKGNVISGLDVVSQMDDIIPSYAGTLFQGNDVLNNGGRVLGVTGLGKTLPDAKNTSYSAVNKISWNGEYHRLDIGGLND